MPLYTKVVKFHYSSFHLSKLVLAFIFSLTVFAITSKHASEKHDTKYQITYGSSKAKLTVIQHFSLGSPIFLRFVKEEFPSLKADFIDTGLVKWTFCPQAADVGTIYFVSCLETLTNEQKSYFFTEVFTELNSNRTSEKNPQIFLRALEKLSISDQKIEFFQLLKIGELFGRVGQTLNQEAFIKATSSIEIGDQVFDHLIHPAAIRYQIEQRL